MSALEQPITESEFKAPAGHYRIVKTRKTENGSEVTLTHFLVHESPDRGVALQLWRDLLNERQHGLRYDFRITVYDDQGRIVDAVGTHIPEAELKAPAGKFRVVCIDAVPNPRVFKLVVDLDDQADAIDCARESDQGPYTGHQVYDETGAALIPVY